MRAVIACIDHILEMKFGRMRNQGSHVGRERVRHVNPDLD